MSAFLEGIAVEIIGSLIDKVGTFVAGEVGNDIDWKIWKSKHHLTGEENDFLDRYAETLVSLQKAGKPKALLQFYGQVHVIQIIHDYWYGTVEEQTFKTDFNNLTHWFTLDQQLTGFSAPNEVFFFLTAFRETVHDNRSAGEAEVYRLLLEILLEIKKEKDSVRIDLYDKIFIFCNQNDRQWVVHELVNELETAGLEVHLDFRLYSAGDFTAWSQKVLASRKTIVVFSKNLSRAEKWLLDGFMGEQQQAIIQDKLLPIQIDDTPVFEEFQEYIDLTNGRSFLQGLQKLTLQLKPTLVLPATQAAFPPLDERYIEISSLPHGGTSNHLFGRQNELNLLDEAWNNPASHVVCFVAHGGVGKSALVCRWLEDLAQENYRGAERVLAVSFYSQGTGVRVTSADKFINEALTWFGEKDFEPLSAWDKGKRLAHLVNAHKTLLVLDGLEPLQEGNIVDAGKVKDPALFVLIRELAKNNHGLCLITTRQALAGFDRYAASIHTENLEQISDGAGKHILRFANVRGDDAALLRAVQNFGNHALAINLLSTYLYASPGHSVAEADNIADLPDVPIEKGKHSRRVIVAFEKLLEKKGRNEAVRLLRLSGLFDRPVPEDIFRRLDDFQNLPAAVQELRRYQLLYTESAHSPSEVDCHPLIREHYEAVLKGDNPDLWQKNHAVLYEYYKALPEKELPDTLEEMEPLFHAVAHGCKAGLQQEALYDVYWDRIQRKNTFLLTKRFSAFSSDLTTLSCFFDHQWDKLVDKLNDDLKPVILGWAGFSLQTLGRLSEGAQLIKAAMELHSQSENWAEASLNASNLNELYLTTGDIKLAVHFSEEGLAYSDKSEDWKRQLVNRATYAYVLYQAGSMEGARHFFAETEQIERKYQLGKQYLYSLRGFWYCDLLLEMEKLEEALERAKIALKIAEEDQFSLDAALYELTLGKAYLQLSQTHSTEDHYQNTVGHLNKAVQELQKTGRQLYLPLGFLARAAYHRLVTQNYPVAEADLEEVLDIAEPSGMRLHLTDYHLEMARLRLAMGQREKAKVHTEQAAVLIAETGYHRRDGELVELQAGLL